MFLRHCVYVITLGCGLLFGHSATAQQTGTAEAAPKFTAPVPANKKFLYNRWQITGMIDEKDGSVETRKPTDELREIQFTAEGKVYFYGNGALVQAIQYELAKDAKSLTLIGNEPGQRMSMEILSLTVNSLVVKSELYQNNSVILKPSKK